MSLASRLQKKLTQNHYELHFEEYDETIYLGPLTVEQKAKVSKLTNDTKQQAMTFLFGAYDQDGEPAAKTEKEVQYLPDSIVGICAAVILFMSQGANHSTLDKFVEHYNAEINPPMNLADIEAITEDELPNQ
ncbi:hypothetical protein [Vibrio fortis]|uniref:hypothetical protein n=1 Tax=Vibrio fortis TaxID=212667 RepID=UPI0038CD4928